MNTVHVIVTCSNRKKGRIPEELKLQNIRGNCVVQRAEEWVKRLAHAETPKRSARDVYMGNHWAVARSIPGNACNGLNIMLWVCSAGYGLIHATTLITPYAATFTPGHADSVSNGCSKERTKKDLQAWWASLTYLSGTKLPNKQISQIVRENPGDGFLVSLSESYLWATAEDLRAASILAAPDRFAILAGNPPKGLEDCTIQLDSRMQHLLGGSKVSLAARLALRAVEHASNAAMFSLKALRVALSCDLKECPAPILTERRSLKDRELEDFIRKQFKTPIHGHAPPSKTKLLRTLRDLGQACEQKRFSRLYGRVREEMRGS